MQTQNHGEIKRVKVFYTGGTIGMQRNDEGVYVPKANSLINTIRKMPHLHNEEVAAELQLSPESPELVLVHMNCKILYSIEEYFPLLDSSNISASNWIQLAQDIKRCYRYYDGFVILHGTDTLAYTASVLSFMLINLRKTVILTGSMIPLFEARTDATYNIVCSLILAGCYVVPEVGLFFRNKLFRGNRTVKMITDGADAFDSPNLPSLAIMDGTEEINTKNIFLSSSCIFCIQDKLCEDVIVLPVYPGITGEVLQRIIKPPVKGVVLQCFGAGNIPTRPDVIEVLKLAIQSEILIVRVTLCLKGSVSDAYEVGAILGKIGIVSGHDMTTEAAFGKLSCVLANSLLTFEEKCQIIGTNIRGELTEP